MQSVILISSVPWNFDLLADAYVKIGKILVTSKEITVQGDWGWFRIQSADDVWQDFDEHELVKVKDVISEPHAAYMEFSSPSVADLAIGWLPVKEEILIDNDMDMLLTAEEIRQRIKFGIPWQCWGETTTGADFFVPFPANDGRLAVVFLDDERVVDLHEREELLNLKLECFVEYFGGKWPWERLAQPELDENDLVVQIVSAQPSEGVKKRIELRYKDKPLRVLPVNFVSDAEFRSQFGFVPHDLPSLRSGS